MRAEKFKRSTFSCLVVAGLQGIAKNVSLGLLHFIFLSCNYRTFFDSLIVMQGHRKRVGIWSSTFWRTESYQSLIFYLPFAQPDVEHFWWPWIVSIRILEKFPSFLYTKALFFQKTNSCNYLFVLDLPLDLIKRFTHHKMDLKDLLSIKT